MTGPESEDDGDLSNSEEIDRLIGLLESEISRVRDEKSQPGWTTWALIGSLATMLWLLMAELEKHIVYRQNTLFLLLALSLAYDCITSVVSIIKLPAPTWHASSKPRSRFRLAHSVLSSGRSRILIDITRLLFLMVAAAEIQSLLNTPYVVATFFYFGMSAVFMMILFVYSFLEIPLPVGSIRRGVVILLGFLLLIPAILALFGFSETLWHQGVSPTAPEWRVGGLLFAITLVLQILAQEQPRTPLLETLIDIRRNLALGLVDLDSARRDTEISLLGMKTADVLQDDLQELLAELGQMDIRTQAMYREYERMAAIMENNEVGTLEDSFALVEDKIASLENQIAAKEDRMAPVEDQIALKGELQALVQGLVVPAEHWFTSVESQLKSIKTALSSTKDHGDEWEAMREEFEGKLARFNGRASSLAWISPDSVEEIKGIRSKLKAEMDRYHSEVKRRRERRRACEDVEEKWHGRLEDRGKTLMEIVDRIGALEELLADAEESR